MKKNIVILCFMILNLVHAESTNWQDKKISFIYDKLPLCSMAQKIGLATKLPVVFFGTENFQKKYVDITPHPKTVQEMIIKLQKLRPGFTIKKEGNAFSYGLLETSGDLDNAITKFDEVFPSIIKLAELEKAAEELALEIEKTRRRVSALENVRIPNLDDTIRFITQRLEEQARDAIVSTMRVKAMIMAKEG